MNINALQPSGSAYSPPAALNSASARQGNSQSSAAVQSTQVTLSAAASLHFYNIPSSLTLETTQQNSAWNSPTWPTGATTQSGAGLLGQFAENELASYLTSPSELNGATVTINSLNTQSSSSAAVAQSSQAGQGTTQTATVLEASNSETLQGSGEITLADGEVIPFTASLSTSESVVETSGIERTGLANSNSDPASDATAAPSASLAPSGASPFDLSTFGQSLLQSATRSDAGTSAQPATRAPDTGTANAWTSMLEQYKLLLNLFDTVKTAVDSSHSAPVAAVGTLNHPSTSTESTANTVPGSAVSSTAL